MPIAATNPLADREAALNLILENSNVKLTDITYPTVSTITDRVPASQTEINWGINVGGTATRRKSVVADATSNDTAAKRPCKLPIGEFAIVHSFTLNLIQLEQAIARGATEDVRNLVATHINDGITEITRDFNSLMYTGTGSDADCAVVGMLTALKPSHNYATLNHALWKSITTRAPATFSASVLYAHERALSEKGQTYTVIFANPKFVESYKNEFDSRRTFTGGDVSANVDLGLGDCYFNGRPIIPDSNCPEGLLIFVDGTKVQIRSYKVQGDASVDRLRFKIAELGTRTAYGIEFEMGLIPQLVIRDRRGVSAIALNADGRTLLEIPNTP
jgi:hypothetical protein